ICNAAKPNFANVGTRARTAMSSLIVTGEPVPPPADCVRGILSFFTLEIDGRSSPFQVERCWRDAAWLGRLATGAGGSKAHYGTSLYPPASVTRISGIAASFSIFWRSR